MKKLTAILMLLIVVGVVSVSGCISVVDSDSNGSILDSVNLGDNATDANTVSTQDDVIDKVNNSGNIVIGNQSSSNKIKESSKNGLNNRTPKISKDEIEKEVVRILKLGDSYLNYTANATLTYLEDGTPLYVVDVYDDYGWYGVFEVNGDKGPVGNDKDGYGFDGGAVRGETGDEPTPIKGVMPKLSVNQARSIMDMELKNNYSIENAYYNVTGYLEDGTPYYNITIEQSDENTHEATPIGNATMNANTGEIVAINVTSDKNDSTNRSDSNDDSNNQKIYSVNEAGNYVDMVYNGKKVAVRENYPYYSPQNDKVFYSQEEEARWLSEYDIGD